jgi:hypothetical protein
LLMSNILIHTTIISIILMRFGFDFSLRLCILYCYRTVNISYSCGRFPLLEEAMGGPVSIGCVLEDQGIKV